jgi:hypothetical protein
MLLWDYGGCVENLQNGFGGRNYKAVTCGQAISCCLDEWVLECRIAPYVTPCCGINRFPAIDFWRFYFLAWWATSRRISRGGSFLKSTHTNK